MLRRHQRALAFLEEKTDYALQSFNTSLAFLYVALHKLDGIMNIRSNSWDIAASVFLATQSGCLVTTIDGDFFELSAQNGVVFAADPAVHKTMLQAINLQGPSL